MKRLNPVNATMEFLTAALHLIVPAKIAKDRLAHIEETVRNATSEGNELAGSLNHIASTSPDPFREFAHRARQSHFKHIIRRGGS